MGSGTFAEILPACGALLHAFSILHNRVPVNVIEQYESIDDFKSHAESKGFKSCKLSPFACRIKDASYRFAGETYTTGKFTLNGSALHGLIYDAPFTVTEEMASAAFARVSMEYAYSGTDPGYPFHYDCQVTYELQPDHVLSIITSVINRDKGNIPMQDGWHPYFTLGNNINELQLEFQSKEKIVFDEAMIPTGEMIPYQEFGSLRKIGDERFDDCFTVNFSECQPLCVLRDPGQGLQVEIYPDRSYPYLQIYTPDHRNSIAIENLSAPPDTFNNGIGLITLAPGTTASFKTSYRLKSL